MRPLVILRPEPGASASAARARELGLDPRVHPLFAPEPVAWSLPEATFDALLLTSANAVRLAGELPSLPVHAVGETTATVARKAGFDVVSVGSGGVDALLANLPAGLSLLHPSGAERIAPDAPRQAITAVTVYRMASLPPPSAEELNGAVVLVHSPAAGRRLEELPVERGTIRLAAISPAAAEACGDGWAVREAAAEPSDAALLSLAAKLCKDNAP